MPRALAIVSATETSVSTSTVEDRSVQTESLNVASPSPTVESIPSWNIVELKSVQLMPEREIEVWMTGVRDGAGVGSDDDDGDEVGLRDGSDVGFELGTAVGESDGSADGRSVGAEVGAIDGAAVGAHVGKPVGSREGGNEGVAEGCEVGNSETDGLGVGWSKTSPSATQKWSENGAERSWKCPPTSSTNSNPISESAEPPPAWSS